MEQQIQQILQALQVIAQTDPELFSQIASEIVQQAQSIAQQSEGGGPQQQTAQQSQQPGGLEQMQQMKYGGLIEAIPNIY